MDTSILYILLMAVALPLMTLIGNLLKKLIGKINNKNVSGALDSALGVVEKILTAELGKLAGGNLLAKIEDELNSIGKG